MKKLQDKVVIVTGASKGIGAAIAKEMANAGAKVVVNYATDKEGSSNVLAEILVNGGTAIAIQADVTKLADVQLLYAATQKEFGKIDVLVNNAGVYKFEPIEAVTEVEFHRQFDRNVLGTILCIQESLKYFNEKGGSIINISSIASVKATPMSMVYTASKSAVDGVTRVLSKELGSKNIRINSILPGPIQTEGNQVIDTPMEEYIVGQTPLGRVGQPEDVAPLAVFLASNEAQWITGEQIGVSGGFD